MTVFLLRSLVRLAGELGLWVIVGPWVSVQCHVFVIRNSHTHSTRLCLETHTKSNVTLQYLCYLDYYPPSWMLIAFRIPCTHCLRSYLLPLLFSFAIQHVSRLFCLYRAAIILHVKLSRFPVTLFVVSVEGSSRTT